MSYKINLLGILELMFFFVIGLLFTIYIASNIYESFGIVFMGNVWVNWFGISFFIFGLHSIIVRLLLLKSSTIFIDRLNSKLFWLFFASSVYIVIIPFILGKNPF